MASSTATYIVQTLESRAVSYDESGPSAQHTALLLRQAAGEIERLRAALAKIADPLTLEVYGIGTERALRIITTMRDIATDALK